MRLQFFIIMLGLLPRVGLSQPVAAPLSQKPAVATPGETYLERDPRLNASLTQRAGSATYRELWNQITRYTKVPLERDNPAREFDDDEIDLGYRKMSARSVMDAIAAIYMARWERTKKDGYIFLVSNYEMRTYQPKNEHQEERYAYGMQFLDGFKRLSPEMQKQLLREEYTSFNSLPLPMQEAAKGVMEALNKEVIANGKSGTTRASDIGENALVNFEIKPKRGFNKYMLTVAIPGRGFTACSFSDYNEYMKEKEKANAQKRQTGKGSDLYSPVKFALTQEAAKRLPALERKVTVQMRDVSFPDVLRYLHNVYNVAYVSNSSSVMPQRANVNIVNLPLGEALDRLTKIYQETEWEWRKLNFLLVRGPQNPSRTQ